jgi:hypothetical protein
MLRSIFVVVVLAVASHPSGAEPCGDGRAFMRNFMQRAASLEQRAMDATLACMFGGSDDKVLDRIGKDMTALYDSLRPIADKTKPFDTRGCMKNGHTAQQYFELGAKSVGVGIGAAYVTCSSKGIARLAELAKQGKTSAELEAETERLSGAWMTTLVPAWMTKP